MPNIHEEDVCFSTIRDDPRTKKALLALKENYHLSDKQERELLQHLSGLIPLWKELNIESPEKKQDRRNTLAYHIRDLAIKIDNDREAKHIRIYDDASFTTTISDKPTLSSYMRDIAGVIKNGLPGYDLYDPYLEHSKTTQNRLKDFVKRNITETLISVTENHTNSPIQPAIDLSNAVLNPASHEEEVTYDQMKSTFKQIKANINKGEDSP